MNILITNSENFDMVLNKITAKFPHYGSIQRLISGVKNHLNKGEHVILSANSYWRHEIQGLASTFEYHVVNEIIPDTEFINCKNFEI